MLEQSCYIAYDLTDLKKSIVITKSTTLPNSLKSIDQLTLKESKKVFDVEKEIIAFCDQKYRPNSDHKELTCKIPTKTMLNSNNVNSLIKQDSIEEIQRNDFSTKDYITKYMIRSITAANFFQVFF